MDNIRALLNEYRQEKYSLYNQYYSMKDWGNVMDAESYLKKYYLDEQEYLQKWKNIQDTIFINQRKGFPKMIFREEFFLFPFRGGILFERTEYEELQKFMLEIEDKYLIIIQNDFGGLEKKTVLRMKYPSTITWEELMSGNFISTVLVEMFANEYFVFSESGLWGKYSANDYDYPLDIVGTKLSVKKQFLKNRKLDKEDMIELYSWLPNEYKEKMRNLIYSI
ncbi:MAG: hypothetical protein ACTTJM_06545 [Bergeyella cardium]